MARPKVYFTTNVFEEINENIKVGQEIKEKIKNLWKELRNVADVEIHQGRFPSSQEIKEKILDPSIRFVGCHLSHKIEAEWLEKSNVIAVSTSTAGYDHVGKVPGIIITHTPSVLQNTVADYTMALILSNLRNIIALHDKVWSGSWKPGEKWDLDENLSRALDNQVVGIIGLGEIGAEVLRRLQPWNVKVLYHDITRVENLEKIFNLEYRSDLRRIFKESDIVTLHMPLNPHTKGIINKTLLKEMKDYSLLVNTARGGVINTNDLLELLENGEVKINLAFDVHETEPLDLDILNRFKKVAQGNPELRFVFAPHNASADANTRGKMTIMLLEDITWLVKSTNIDDLKDCRIVKQQRKELQAEKGIKQYRIKKYWDEK
ncbi:MAG: NAD(P)-dependent oxidoreductase [Candidatus Hodarchaeota archaeon]